MRETNLVGQIRGDSMSNIHYIIEGKDYKECSSCKGLFTLDNFWKDKYKPDGYCYYCKNCQKLYKLQLKMKEAK